MLTETTPPKAPNNTKSNNLTRENIVKTFLKTTIPTNKITINIKKPEKQPTKSPLRFLKLAETKPDTKAPIINENEEKKLNIPGNIKENLENIKENSTENKKEKIKPIISEIKKVLTLLHENTLPLALILLFTKISKLSNHRTKIQR